MDPGIVQEAWDIQFQDYRDVVSVVLLFWDHLLTLNAEVSYIWSRPRVKSSVIFLIHRYTGLVGNLVLFVLSRRSSESLCEPASLFRQILLIANQGTVCLIVTLRIYALYQCSKKVLTFFCILACCVIGLVGWSVTGPGQDKILPTLPGSCHIGFNMVTAIRLAICWECLFVYDAALFAMTFYKSRKTEPHVKNGLFTLLFRDGAIYFACMAMANLGNILTFYLARPFLRGCLGTLASALAITLVSRMTLNLHAVSHIGVMSTMTGVLFASHPGLSPQEQREMAMWMEDFGNTNETTGISAPSYSSSHSIGPLGTFRSNTSTSEWID